MEKHDLAWHTAVREVRNPANTFKLDAVAERYALDKEQFRIICQKLPKHWPLLKQESGGLRAQT